MVYEGPMEMRGINFWAHIKNWYEVHSLEDNKRLLEDMASMGFNDFWVAFVRGWFKNYFDEEVSNDYEKEYWWKQKELAKVAHELGMKVTMVDSVNQVFSDQYSDPELSKFFAETPKSGLWKGILPYLLCPSKPKAREIIIKNHEDGYKDFPVIDALVPWPYDYGGCGCDECHPWPKTFVELSKEMTDKLRKYHPEASVYLSVWDMTDEEANLFARYLREDKPDWVQGVVEKDWRLISIKDGGLTERWKELKLPEKYKKIPYIDLCQIGAWGWHVFTSNPHPARFEKLFKEMRKEGVINYGCYSEDVHDDINKFLVAKFGLSSKKSSKDLIKEYCLKYFQAAVGGDVYEVAHLMEDEYTNKFASPWEQKPIMNRDIAQKMLSILRDVEKRIPKYSAKSFRWQVLIKRAEISMLLNDIGSIDEFKGKIKSLIQEALAGSSAEEVKDTLRKAEVLILEKRHYLESLKETIDSFKIDVLEEPEDRTIGVLSALPSYYQWMKMLIEMEESVSSPLRQLAYKRIQDTLRERLRLFE